MAYASGTISLVSKGVMSVSLSATPATGGVGPYTYQWYRSQTVAFTPGVGNILTGFTSLQVIDTSALPGTLYYYKLVSLDVGNANAPITSNELSVTTELGNQIQNQFVQAPVVGQVDMRLNYNTIAVKMDTTFVGSAISGQPVKVSQEAGRIPVVTLATADTDIVFGVINFNIKDKVYIAGDMMEISQKGNVIYLVATAAIARGARVMIDVLTPGGVKTATSGKNAIGFALDVATSVGQIIRIEIEAPNYILVA